LAVGSCASDVPIGGSGAQRVVPAATGCGVLIGPAHVVTGAACIAAGATVIADRDVLLGVAGIVAGVALIAIGASFIGPRAIAARALQMYDWATKAPSGTNLSSCANAHQRER
jgi:hypothetical protein